MVVVPSFLQASANSLIAAFELWPVLRGHKRVITKSKFTISRLRSAEERSKNEYVMLINKYSEHCSKQLLEFHLHIVLTTTAYLPFIYAVLNGSGIWTN